VRRVFFGFFGITFFNSFGMVLSMSLDEIVGFENEVSAALRAIVPLLETLDGLRKVDRKCEKNFKAAKKIAKRSYDKSVLLDGFRARSSLSANLVARKLCHVSEAYGHSERSLYGISKDIMNRTEGFHYFWNYELFELVDILSQPRYGKGFFGARIDNNGTLVGMALLSLLTLDRRRVQYSNIRDKTLEILRDDRVYPVCQVVGLNLWYYRS
jgi:hypothetical protein